MRIEQLLYFQEAIRFGSISAAAKNLYISHQTLTAALKSLEKELGYTLFETSHYGISATPQGEIVLETAKQVLACIDAMTISLSNNSAALSTKEHVLIQIAVVVAEYLLPDMLQTIMNQFPHVTVSVEHHSPLHIIENIQDNKGNLGILGIQYPLLHELGFTSVLSNELTFMPLFQYELSVAVSTHHPLSNYKSVSIKTLMKYPIIFQSSFPLEEDLNYQWLKLYGEPIIKSVTPFNNLYIESIKSGAAIGFFPNINHKRINTFLDNDIKLIPLNEKNAIHTVGYLYNNTYPVSPATQIIINELKKFK